MIGPTVDVHCHLDLYPDPHAQILKIVQQKSYLLSVTNTPRAWRGTASLAAGCPRIKTALGLHPQLAKERKSELPLFDELLTEVRYVGEVGLDGGPDCRSFWQDQVEVFDHILASCVNVGGRILTVHSRAAATEVLNAFDRHPGYGVAILHWFSGTQGELSRAVEMGCWFSVGSAMLRSQKGRNLTARMPADRVLTETDGPFGMVSGKPLQPGECGETLRALAKLWHIDTSTAQERVLSSFRELVSL